MQDGLFIIGASEKIIQLPCKLSRPFFQQRKHRLEISCFGGLCHVSCKRFYFDSIAQLVKRSNCFSKLFCGIFRWMNPLTGTNPSVFMAQHVFFQILAVFQQF